MELLLTLNGIAGKVVPSGRPRASSSTAEVVSSAFSTEELANLGLLGDDEDAMDLEAPTQSTSQGATLNGEPIQLGGGIVTPPRIMRTDKSIGFLFLKQARQTIDYKPVRVRIPRFHDANQFTRCLA